MKPNRMLGLLREGKFTCGCWVSLCSPLAAEVMGLAGFDWLLVDMEHGAGDYQTLLGQLHAIESAGETTPVVRVQGNDPNIIKRVLDLGAQGVMVPGIRSVEEARQAVAGVRYPPEGMRGIASVRASRFGQDPSYLKEANGNIALFLQFETRQAVENATQILALPGIDVAFIGPNDLAAALGHTGELTHPEVREAIGRVEQAARQQGIPLGTVSRGWEQASALVDQGYRAVSITGDAALLGHGARTLVKSFREHPHVAGG